MTAPCLVDDGLVQCGDVVRAHQPQWGVVIDRQVEQCLVQLRLDDFRGPPTRPDGFAHAPDGLAVGAGHEVPPRRNDAGRVAAEFGHVEQNHSRRVRSERLANGCEPRFGDRDHHRLIQRQPVQNERHNRRKELVGTAVEHALVPVGVVRRPRPSGCGGRGCQPVVVGRWWRSAGFAAPLERDGGTDPFREGGNPVDDGRVVGLLLPVSAIVGALVRFRAGLRPHQSKVSAGPRRGEIVRGGDDEFNESQRRLDQPVVRRRMRNDLVQHALVVGSGEDVFAAGDDVLAGKSLHRTPLVPS